MLGIGYSSSQAAAKSAALAGNSTTSQTSSSSIVNTALLNQNNQVYRHPIVYDKLTGATNNQINDVLGSKQQQGNDYPLDHYQQQLQLHQQQPNINQPFNRAFNPLGQEDFFARQPPAGMVGFPSHPLSRHLQPAMMGHPSQMMTTQPPNMQQQQLAGMPLPPLPPPNSQQRDRPFDLQNHPIMSNANSAATSADSLPSASSLNNDGARPNITARQQLQQQPQQPVYYTPPIFAYNNFDQARPLSELQLAQYGYGVPIQQQQQQRVGVPLGVPEAPMSVDEYNARQARLRQVSNQQHQQPAAVPQRLAPANVEPQFSSSVNGPPAAGSQQSSNLLGEPEQQQRHKQQMLDRQLLFNGAPLNDSNGGQNISSYYPDPALYRPQASQGANIRPPYAHNGVQGDPQFGSLKQPPAQNRVMPQNHRIESQPLKAPAGKPTGQQQQQLASVNLISDAQLNPSCARQQFELSGNSLELANSSTQLPVLFCNDDTEYPTKDIMRALEVYASERSIEQLLPQSLVQLYLSHRSSNDPSSSGKQLILDSLQPTIGNQAKQGSQDSQSSGQLQVSFDDTQTRPVVPANNLFPSSNYEPLCKANVYMAQPRRAKNLLNQWKVIVNLPGHKYRGIAISQMLRLEECSRPNSECFASGAPATGLVSGARGMPQQQSILSKSRCLQLYENQRLVAWSHQQGLHLDIFRVPIACSCHIRR